MQPTELRKKIHFKVPKDVLNQDGKAAYISEIVGREISSTKELSHEELLLVFYRLAIYDKSEYGHYAIADAGNKQHRYIMSLCHQGGDQWLFYNKRLGKEVPNMESLGAWLASERSPVRKPLCTMNTGELSKVIFAFEQVVSHSAQKKREESMNHPEEVVMKISAAPMLSYTDFPEKPKSKYHD